MSNEVFLTYDQAALDREYDNRGKVDDFQKYLDDYAGISAAVRDEMPCDLDIAYGFRHSGKHFWSHRAMSTAPHLLSQVSKNSQDFELRRTMFMETPNGEKRSVSEVTDSRVAQMQNPWLAVFPVAVTAAKDVGLFLAHRPF